MLFVTTKDVLVNFHVLSVLFVILCLLHQVSLLDTIMYLGMRCIDGLLDTIMYLDTCYIVHGGP